MLEARMDRLCAEVAELRAERSTSQRPRRRQRRRTPLTPPQARYLQAWFACNENNAEACRQLKIAPSTGQQHLRLIEKKAKAWGITIRSLVGGPAPSRATRFLQDRGQDEVPDR